MRTVMRRHTVAGALTNRAPATHRPTWFGANDHHITKAYHLAHRTLPPPHPRLSRAEVVLLRQLQTGSLPSPGVMHRMYLETYPTDKCLLEGDGRSHAHLVGLHQTPRVSNIKNNPVVARGSREELRPRPTALGCPAGLRGTRKAGTKPAGNG
ncbi:hypothetical protein HPB49_021132 [Dermacentor silvarum]|uniref:Uncharacterized protein n=1 Tax=Dermacentor silvarum TaxID=543639 RepID=A0ACB8CT14_DERSI|nr:hypothetical protein HPB49_021132 [Dermacentor silvarum]